MKISKLWISLFSFVIMVVLGASIIILVNRGKQEEITHNYVSSIVTNKYINEGFAGVYQYKDTEYIIVSETSEGEMITTYVDVVVYSSYNLGDTIFYCKNHNKLKIYE